MAREQELQRSLPPEIRGTVQGEVRLEVQYPQDCAHGSLVDPGGGRFPK